MIFCLILLNFPWFMDVTHQRGIAIVIGALIAFYLLVLVEIYLGTTGFYFAPIGKNDRGAFAYIDVPLIAAFKFLYYHGSAYKSWIGVAVYLVAYYVLNRILPKTANGLLNVYSGAGAAIAVLLMLPFAHALDEKQVAFTKAMLDASSSLKTLGAYETAKAEAEKENEALKRLVSELQNEDQRKELIKAIDTYSDLLVQLDDRGRIKRQILYQPSDDATSVPFLNLPNKRYPIPPNPPIAALPADEGWSNVSPVDAAHAESLTERRDKLLNELEQLRKDRDEALTKLRLFVQGEVEAQLGVVRRPQVVNEAIDAILQEILLRDIAEAIRELNLRIEELRNRLQQEDNENEGLRTAMGEYRNFLLAMRRRQSVCSSILSDVARYLQSDGRNILMNFEVLREQVGARLSTDQPVINQIALPPGANREALERSVSEQLTSEGVSPPQYTPANLTSDVSSVSDRVALPIANYVNAMCLAGRDANQIISSLQQLNNELRRPAPPPLRSPG
jgi:hypothetical protein